MEQTTIEVLVVAGLSGSGKTTFLRQLQAKELPSDIAALLPQQCETWPQSKWKNGAVVQRVRDGSLRKLVLHVALNSLDKQRQLLALMREFDRVTIINIATPLASLVNRLRERCVEAATRKDLDSVRRILGGINKYNQSGWHEAVIKNFKDGMRAATEAGVKLENIYIEPDLYSHGADDPSYRWRLSRI